MNTFVQRHFSPKSKIYDNFVFVCSRHPPNRFRKFCRCCFFCFADKCGPACQAVAVAPAAGGPTATTFAAKRDPGGSFSPTSAGVGLTPTTSTRSIDRGRIRLPGPASLGSESADASARSWDDDNEDMGITGSAAPHFQWAAWVLCRCAKTTKKSGK